MRSEVEQLHSELELNRSGTRSPERDPQQHYDSDSDGNKNNRRKSEEASHGAGSSMDLADREKFGILEVSGTCFFFSYFFIVQYFFNLILHFLAFLFCLDSSSTNYGRSTKIATGKIFSYGCGQ